MSRPDVFPAADPVTLNAIMDAPSPFSPAKPEGCWAAYAYDYGPYLLSVHPTEVEALRAAVDGSGYSVFLPWGMRLADAIKMAEPSR